MIYYLITINVLSFIVMGIDKHNAINNKYRVSEKSLFILSIFGGAIGTLIAMFVFRHKIRKKTFIIGIPLIIIIELYILLK